VGGIDDVFDLKKLLFDELGAVRSGGYRNLDTNPRLPTGLTIGGEQNRVVQVAGVILPKFLATPNAHLSQITIVLPPTRNSFSPVKSLHILQVRIPVSSPASLVIDNGCPDARIRCRASRSRASATSLGYVPHTALP
jgi:hypothetical protein